MHATATLDAVVQTHPVKGDVQANLYEPVRLARLPARYDMCSVKR